MGVLDAFMSTWSDARESFGQGSPQNGAQFDRSMHLRSLQTAAESAAPGSRWTGAAAHSYGSANADHGHVLGRMAELDKRMAVEIDRSAHLVDAGRRDLNALRGWVLDAAASLPRNHAGERMLVPIVQKGISEMAQIVARSNGDLGTVGRRLHEITGEYQALNNQHHGRTPAAPFDRTVEGEAVPADLPGNDEAWQIASKSPTMLEQWEQLKKQGWKFTFEAGKGSYTSYDDKVMNIDPALRSDPSQYVATMAHEMGHALYGPPKIDHSSREACIQAQLDNEGAATINAIKIEREILAAGGPDIIGPSPVNDEFEKIYDGYVASGSTPEAYQAAIRAIGEKFGTLTPSTDPDSNYTDYYGQACPA